MTAPDSSVQPETGSRSTAGWWGFVVAAEVVALVGLGVMAYGERFPFYPHQPPSLAPSTHSDTVGLVILAVVGVGLLGLPDRWWWKPGLAAALAVVLAVVVIAFGWGREDPRLYALDHPGLQSDIPTFGRDVDACRERAPTAAQEAFAVGRVPDECRDIWINAGTTTTTLPPTTTTVAPAQMARTALNRSLNAGDRAALKALANTYDVLARALDNNDQAALIALRAALESGDRKLKDAVGEVLANTLDSLDRTALQLAYDANARLGDQLTPADWVAIDRYLSFVRPSPSDFDRTLDAMVLRLNMTELEALLDT